MDERKHLGHWVAVALYWLVVLALLGEFGSSDQKVSQNAMLPWVFLAVVAFGIWRVARKWRTKRQQPARGS